MSSEVVFNGVDSLVEKPKEKLAPAGLIPDPKYDAELDWVVVQIAVSADGALTTLQELRGWWVDKNYTSVSYENRRRTRVVTQGQQGEYVKYDSSKI